VSNRSYSYSDYSTALSCLRKYKLVKVDQLVPDVPGSGDMAFGTAMHAAINACLKGDDYEEVLKLYLGDMSEQDLEYGRFGLVELANLGKEFMRKFAKTYARDFKPQVMEKRLYAEYKGVRLEGTPDLVGRYKDTLVVADWKTAGSNYSKDKAQVGLQLWLYAYLATVSLDFKPEKLLYLVLNKGTGSIQTPVTVDFSQTKMFDALDDMVHYLKTVDAETVFPKNLNSCIIGTNKCQYWKVCHGN
jgi:hypothetical protein